MLFSVRRVAPVVLVVCLGLVAGCGSNNKGKIEGKWKMVSPPDKGDAKAKADMAKMGEMGMYLFMEFKPDGVFVIGLGADTEEKLNFFKAFAPGGKLTWDAKYKLLNGDGVEVYDMPKDLQTGSGGMFGNKDRGRANIKINGDDMTMTDDSGTTKLTRIK